MALLNHDRAMHNIPNVTSPGRLMIGPKVATNEALMGPMQRFAQEQRKGEENEPYRDSKEPEKLKKSSSKDSLMSNMLYTVSKFLGGGGKKDVIDQKVASETEDQTFLNSAPPSNGPNSYSSSFNN